MSISNAFIIGAGQMGAGIAQVLASVGIKVCLFDMNPDQLKLAVSGIEKSLLKLSEKGKIDSNSVSKTMVNISTNNELPSTLDFDLILEAVIENIDIKKKLIESLHGKARSDSIIATNTSSLSITRIAESAPDPEKVIGMHFMNPVPLMGLVEIIRGLQTSNECYSEVVDLTKRLGKVPITAEKDYPGFIVNRILVPMINEAFFVLMEGIASPEDIDNAMRLGTNQPMGPLALADFVGLDTCLFITETFHRELGEDKYRPCPLLRKYVEAGWFGRKSGRGVYSY
ncbi:MAG TPA: 3-hydroxyacyl-CoA dehydrogenase NAD-binding domain-containing protein [Oligoflexia bacterium]|nr:3-hydroxyacyl-CoA dehydrogenase NAD-binding domain-containing protein [Oligoflexia bacterium]HMP49184.1 3-hydroxyacyl-CoA dehydrogenase NAD-binding domain-containing protein [Oligoflexia bacterium]